MATQANAFIEHAKELGLPLGIVLRDRDCKFSAGFDETLKAADTRVVRARYRSPNVNAYVERFVQLIEQDCLDKLIVFRTEHFDHVAGEYLAHYHEERPHQGKGNAPLRATAVATEGEVACRERLGGLLRHYYRRAA